MNTSIPAGLICASIALIALAYNIAFKKNLFRSRWFSIVFVSDVAWLLFTALQFIFGKEHF